MTELEAKRYFAELMLRHPGKFNHNARLVAAAGKIYDDNVIYNIERFWPLDKEVLQFRKELIETAGGEEEFLPTRAQVAHSLWAIAEAAVDPEAKIKALKEYSTLRGFVEKNPAPPSIVLVNKVMAFRDHGDDDDWKLKLKANQQKLIEHVE